MAYFSHAFQKTFIQNSSFVASGTSSNMGVGDLGFFDAKTWNAIPLSQASVAQHPKVVLAMGAYRFSAPDNVGSHGGYKESVKSPVIQPRNVHRFWKVPPRQAQAHAVLLGWDGINNSTIPNFYCGQTYHLRIDVKGSPVLRLVDHHVHHTFDVRTSCCIGETPVLVDPVPVLLSFARQINESAIVSNFLHAEVFLFGLADIVDPDTYVIETDPSDIANKAAGIRLTGAYSDTRFNYFSFDPRDHFELEPVVISSAQLIDDSGDPCSLFKQLTFTQEYAPLGVQGSGEQVLREMIMDNEYRQDPFPWDARKKDIADFGYLAAGLAIPMLLYDSYYILFSAPRKYNPSGVYDNDQYLLRVCAQMGSDQLADFEVWFGTYLNSAGTGVELEELV